MLLTIKPPNLKKPYSQISEKSDQTSINLTNVFSNYVGFGEILCLVPLLNMLHKNLQQSQNLRQ